MQPLTAAATSALKASHVALAKAEVYDGGLLAATLYPTAGSVQVDQSNAFRRKCSVTLTDPTGTLTPASANDLLAAYGNELRLYRGVRTTTDEYVPLGVFGISEADVDDAPDGLTIKVAGFDRARRVSRSRFPDTYQVPAGTNYATAIRNLITSRVPVLMYNLVPTTATTPLLTFDAGDDPWKAAQAMADAIGQDLFFDPDGVVVSRTRVAATVPVWSFDEGANATLLKISKRSKDEQTYNHVVVTGESPDNAAPVRAEAKDTVPSSPTYYLGDYGDVVRFYSSPFITSTQQAQAVADALLVRTLGQTEQVAFDAIPQPALDAGDVVRVTRARSKISGLYVIDALDVPLRPDGTMGVNLRQRR